LQWPLLREQVEASARDGLITGAGIVARERHLILAPRLIRGEASDRVANLLGKANVALARCHAVQRSSTAGDCLRLAWRYLRTVEWLPVPVSFYEQESGSFWGLKPLSQLTKVTSRFVDAIRGSDPAVAKLVDEAVADVDAAVELMRQHGVPFWDALRTVCIDSSNSTSATEVLFLARGRRHLVELALLGLEGVTQEDLSKVNVRLTDITQRRTREQDSEGNREASVLARGEYKQDEVLLVGLPAIAQLAKVYAQTDGRPLRVLLYPYQVRLLRSRLEQFVQTAGIKDDEQIRALQECGVSLHVGDQPLKLAPDMRVDEATQLLMGRSGQNAEDTKTPEWGRLFSDSEVNSLLSTEDDDDGEAVDVLIDEAPTEGAKTDIAVERAIDLTISGRRRGLFLPDYMVNVVRTVDGRETIVERTVRSLSVGNHLILVHGQRRQSLYELLLTRVHRHPSLQLHLALIKAWQDEIAESFAKWRVSGKGYSELLAQMGNEGSSIESTLALRFWTEGSVLCPQDPADLPRIASVLSMNFTAEHHVRIAKAAERLRGLHRGLALRLTHWLRREAAGGQQDGDDEVIDAELGLTMRDFRDSLEIVTVEQICERQGLYLVANLNGFRPY